MGGVIRVTIDDERGEFFSTKNNQNPFMLLNEAKGALSILVENLTYQTLGIKIIVDGENLSQNDITWVKLLPRERLHEKNVIFGQLQGEIQVMAYVMSENLSKNPDKTIKIFYKNIQKVEIAS